MVEYNAALLDKTFHALANPTRRAIMRRLAGQQATVLEIAEQFEMSLNGVSKHVKVLERAGLIQREVQGRVHTCSLLAEPLQEAQSWLDYYQPFWEKRLEALEQFVIKKQQADQDASDAASSDDGG